MGGVDWAGLPIVVEWLGIQDVDGLLFRMSVIKNHQASRGERDAPQE